MNLKNNALCNDQHQALSSYLDSLLSLPEELSISATVPSLPPTPVAPHVFASALEAPPLPVARRAGASLKCFVFSVAGVKLALPLARVSEIIDFAECGGAAVPPLVLGRVAHEGQQVPVLDTAAIVLPDSKLTPSYQWLVMVDHGSYALACDSVDPGMEVAHDAVRWRTPLTKRRWLAGTLLQQRCALLDADEVYDQSADTVS
jgi:purine-binding chemotaxis protein CheW